MLMCWRLHAKLLRIVFFSVQDFIVPAVASLTDKSITHLVYSHAHQDHIAGAGSLELGYSVEIVASVATAKQLEMKQVRLATCSTPGCFIS
jgi:phosphoribosyl 1,2-cyclic phosphodiesterase